MKEYSEFKKSIIQKEKNIMLKQKVLEKAKLKNEIDSTAREISDKLSKEKRENTEKLRLERENKKREY